MDTIVLIPAYNPGPALCETVMGLHQAGFSVVVVNDGSHPDQAVHFEQAAGYADVSGYPRNLGKGRALKHGIEYIKEKYPDAKYLITADADGQHTIEDITRTRDALYETKGMVVGSREFKGNIPLRSRIGNDMSRFTYAVSTGLYLRDNQSGLRGFPLTLADWLIRIPGDRYEYEMNVLVYAAKEGIPMRELTIDTVYIEGNKSSHFRPIPDTLRIQGAILGSSIGAMVGHLLGYVVLLFLVGILSALGDGPSVWLAALISSALGLLMSLLFNRLAYHLPPLKPMNFLRFLFRLGLLMGFMELFSDLLDAPLWLGGLLAYLLSAVPIYYFNKLLACLCNKRGGKRV